MGLSIDAIQRIKALLAPRLPDAVLLNALFEAQRILFTDPSKRKAALCTRRAGKSHTAAALLIASLLQPGTLNLYLTLTNKSAKSIMWPKLTEMLRYLGLTSACKISESAQTIKYGESTIRLLGADLANIADRLRGVAYNRVIIDEAQSFSDVSLTQLLDDVLEPALLDCDGDLVLIGTPGIAPIGRFFDITSGNTSYSLHKWSVHDNPHIPHSQTWIANLLKERCWTTDNPTYRREYLGEWVIDPNKQVYKFNPSVNKCTGKPSDVPKASWQYIIGVDFGWHDATAIVVVAFSLRHHAAFVVDSWSQSHATPTVVAEKLKEFQEYYLPDKIVCDSGGLGRAIIEDFRYRYGLTLWQAEKTDKMAAIEMINGDFIDQRMFVDGSQVDLIQQLLTLTWDDRYKENQTQRNDLLDAMLYAHRASRHYWGHIRKPLSEVDAAEQAIVDFAIEKHRLEIEGDDEWN